MHLTLKELNDKKFKSSILHVVMKDNCGLPKKKMKDNCSIS